MNVLLIGTEALPFAKSGGLGDVLGALPKALVKQKVHAAVMLPLYQTIKEKWLPEMELVAEFETLLAWRKKYTGIYKMNHDGVDFYFIDNEDYFKREKYYGYFDDGERFAYFCKASLDALAFIDFKPDILHLSEWQSALVPIYLKACYGGIPEYDRLRTVFTIHNIEYQGQFDPGILQDLLGIDERYRGMMEFDGQINFVKGAIIACDRLTTVSPTYAKELQYAFYAKGLEKIIRDNAYKFSGILNGIDEKFFSPKFDSCIAAKYGKKTAERKGKNKTDLQDRLGLDVCEESIMIGMITRLVPHKGIDLVLRAFDEIMQENVQFVLLGSGDRQYESSFREKMKAYPKAFSYHSGFSDDLARRIYAGADLFLMPSISEPCGLAQMIACKHGTVPIVRETGGLADSITAFNPKTGMGNGITFVQINAHEMLDAIKRALLLFGDEHHKMQVINNAFDSDFSWKRGAGEYKKIYRELGSSNK